MKGVETTLGNARAPAAGMICQWLKRLPCERVWADACLETQHYSEAVAYGSADKLNAADKAALSEDCDALFVSLPPPFKNAKNFFALDRLIRQHGGDQITKLLSSETSYYAVKYANAEATSTGKKRLEGQLVSPNNPESKIVVQDFGVGLNAPVWMIKCGATSDPDFGKYRSRALTKACPARARARARATTNQEEDNTRASAIYQSQPPG